MEKKGRRIAFLVSGIGIETGTNIYELTYLRYFANKYKFSSKFIFFDQYEDDKREEEIEKMKILTTDDYMLLSETNAADFDILFLPSGKGNINILTDFAKQGVVCNINEDLQILIKRTHKRNNYIVALGEGSILLTRALKGLEFNYEPVIAFGSEIKNQKQIELFGFSVVNADPKDVIIDNVNKFMSCLGLKNSFRFKDLFDTLELIFSELDNMIMKRERRKND